MRKFYTLITCVMIGVISLQAQIVKDTTTFEDLELQPASYWNGSDSSGSFKSGELIFPNHYNPDWGSWSHWAYSNMADDTTAGFMNMYSAITAAGVDTPGSSGKNYGLCNVPIDFMSSETIPVAMKTVDSSSLSVAGLHITNSTYAALSMEYGDDFAKKFGGESGNDPDWFLLSIWGYSNGISSDTIEFYLADYRFGDNDLDYIVKSWEWIDLSAIGKIDSLMFNLQSSDVGDYGINTPSYFCIDNIIVEKDVSRVFDIKTELNAGIYPNPATGKFRIGLENHKAASIKIIDLQGKIVYADEYYVSDERIHVDLPAGIYVIHIEKEKIVANKKLVIK